jgi:diacylglycerol kinase
MSFVHAGRGIGRLVATQPNAKIHLAATTAVVLLGWKLSVSRQDWLWLVGAIALVWSAEGINSALEALCDIVHPDRHDRIRDAKDLAAGAVLLASIGAAIIGCLVFIPALIKLFATN